MIVLTKDGIVLEVGTEVQASAFFKNGWTVVEKPAEKPAPAPTVVKTDAVPEVNRRRSVRKPK